MHFLGISTETLGDSYFGVNLNSDCSRQYGMEDFDLLQLNQLMTRGDWKLGLEQIDFEYQNDP